MTDRIPRTDREPRAHLSVIPFEPGAAYVLGYADGRRLLTAQERAEDCLVSVRARYLAHVEAAELSPADQAYLAGVRDAAADNLPSPPSEPYRHAA